jgi:hypothetical protein
MMAVKMMCSGKIWTTNEIDYLKANYPTTTARKIGEHLGRSRMAVWKKAYDLDLRITSRKTHDVKVVKRSPKQKPIKMNESETQLAVKFLGVLAIAKGYSEQTKQRANVNLAQLRYAFQVY